MADETKETLLNELMEINFQMEAAIKAKKADAEAHKDRIKDLQDQLDDILIRLRQHGE